MPLGRWALVAAILLTGAALAVTTWSTRAGVRDATDALIRGQANLLQHDLHTRLADLGRPPEAADLAEVIEDNAAGGLMFVMLMGGDEWPALRAGTTSADEASLAEAVRAFPTDLPVWVGDRVRVVFRGPPRRRMHGPRRPMAMLVEFVPLQAQALDREAARTLTIGGIAAGTLLLVALALVRAFIRRAAVERQLESQRRLAMVGQLSAVLAHEIRNPLTSLKGNAQLLAGMLPDGEKPRAKADRVVEEAVRLEELTNDLLEFARTGELRRADVDPAKLLGECARAGVTLDTARAPSSWSLDAERMRQALTNLIDNAVQAGPPVRASVAIAGDRLVFEVRDSGPGIAAEDMTRVFEPFYTKRTRGTGLGLAVVKRAVELHGGTISVANDGGAVFRVSLPRGAG